jgi:hypothetical protein
MNIKRLWGTINSQCVVKVWARNLLTRPFLTNFVSAPINKLHRIDFGLKQGDLSFGILVIGFAGCVF